MVKLLEHFKIFQNFLNFNIEIWKIDQMFRIKTKSCKFVLIKAFLCKYKTILKQSSKLYRSKNVYSLVSKTL